MKGIIWSCDRTGDGVEKLEYIIDRYEWTGIPVTRYVIKRDGSWAEFANGDSWRVVGMSESARGIKSNIAWIDSRINKEFFQTRIRNTLISYNGPCYYEFFMPRGDN